MTSHLEPLDAGIIRNVKHFYRNCTVKRSLASVEHGKQPTGITILDATHYLAAAWSVVTAATVADCFTICFGGTACTDETVGDDVSEYCHQLDTDMEAVGANGIAYSDYASVDNAVATSEVLTIDQLVAETSTIDDKVEE
ncbi:tigger transposable element-derived protein 4-like [Dermacentor albipictus]|uniref:tigger transposable element-derived protein 4-like n=1 Tax=Dermacentor albipictus TaxID=60249 RepID=UPI0038FC01EF